MERIQVRARPEPVEIETGRTAVIVVDMQNDFGSKGGMFDRAGIDISPIQAIVPRIADVIANARIAGMTIVFLRQQHSPDLSDTGGPQSPHWVKHRRMQLGEVFPAPDGTVGRVLVRETWNTDNVPGLAPEPGDLVVGKSRFSGFFNTDLDVRLRGAGIKYLVFTGATTSICVESTVRDAMFRDYICIVLEDCTAEPIAFGAARSNHEASLLNIELLFGWVAKAADLQASLQSQREAAE